MQKMVWIFTFFHSSFSHPVLILAKDLMKRKKYKTTRFSQFFNSKNTPFSSVLLLWELASWKFATESRILVIFYATSLLPQRFQSVRILFLVISGSIIAFFISHFEMSKKSITYFLYPITSSREFMLGITGGSAGKLYIAQRLCNANISDGIILLNGYPQVALRVR